MISDLKALVNRAEEKASALHASMRQCRRAADIAGMTGDLATKRRLNGHADLLSREMMSAESELHELRQRRYAAA